MILPYFPILAVDIAGSICMILFSMLALNNAIKLKKRDNDNVMFLYLLWICWGFTVFAFSRALGHLVRQLMVIYGHSDLWAVISPYSGTINTVSFMLMGVLTLFFNQNWKINIKILNSRRELEETNKALEDTHIKLVQLNQTLEQKVAERTAIIMNNINEKKEMEQQIAQADKLAALGELAAGVAHEINNPLGIILGYTQLMLKDKSIKDSDYYEDLKVIEKHVKNCKTVVSDMLAFSRKSSSKQSVINLNNIVNDVVKFFHNHSDFKNIKITLELYNSDLKSSDSNKFDNSLNILGNEQEMRQVLINLLINACHAVDKKGEIDIKTSIKENEHVPDIIDENAIIENNNFKESNNYREAQISVQDNGKGITPENLSRIFDPFFTTKPVGQGTGLGLSVSYGIVKKHGGRIEVQSSENEGAVFNVILPIYEIS